MYASSYFDACIPPIANILLSRMELAPLKVSTLGGTVLRLFYFIFVHELDEDHIAKVESVPTDLISVVVSEMMDLSMFLIAFVMKRKAMTMTGVKQIALIFTRFIWCVELHDI